MAIILGIDPGSRVTGYGLIRQQGRQLSYIASGCIRTVVDDMPTRLKLIYAGVSEIITSFSPISSPSNRCLWPRTRIRRSSSARRAASRSWRR